MATENLQGTLTLLDLDHFILKGWEPEKSIETVAAIIEGIKQGDPIPAVFVYRESQRVYKLAFGHKDIIDSPRTKLKRTLTGGHNRAVAHFIEGKPLRAIVLPGKPKRLPYKKVYGYDWLRVEEINLVSDPNDYQKRKEIYHYR